MVGKGIDKKAISPVIATVLLVVVAIALFLLIFFWLRGFQKEAILKYGTPVETVCSNIRYEATYSGNILQVTNTGSVVISKVDVFKIEPSKTTRAGDIKNIQPATSATYSLQDCQKIKVVPYLLGTTKSGAYKEYACENQAKIISC